MRRALAPSLLLVAVPASAHDIGGVESVPGWTWDAWLTVPLALSLLIFVAGWLRLHRRSRRGAEPLVRRALSFGSGWLVLAGALVSPLHQLGERSFAAHMFEHELLMLVAAPLLVLAEPLAVMLWAFPGPTRRGIGAVAASGPVRGLWHALSAPVAATLLQAAALWLWHAPALFDRALGSEAWHAAQHVCFFVTGLIFWSAMFGPRTPRGVAVLCLFATSLVSGALGALMAFAASPWYPRYAALGLAPFGLTPTEDQQLAGLLMWVPGGMVHAGAALLLVYAMLRGDAREVVHAG